MKRQRLLVLAVGIASFFTLLFGIGAGHSLATISVMPNMGKQMTQNQCQSSCKSQTSNVVHSQKTVIDDKDIEPQPAEPYYLAFMGVGWTTVITVAAAYLLKYLNWRPPDLYKLNVAYRF